MNIMRKYDDLNGNKIYEVYSGKDKKSVLIKDGYAAIKYKYDDYGTPFV